MLVPPLRNPTQISANWEQACALHDGGVKCWDTKGAAYVPLSDHAKFVSAGAPCVASDSEVLCWKVESGRVRVSRASNFSQISQMADNDSSACVLSAAGVDCRGWGGPSYVPPLRNPTRVLGSYCAVDDFGLRCWWGPSREPHFASSSFSAMRAEIPKGTTPARAAYLAALFAFAEKNFAAEGSLSPDAYALFALTEPAVTSMDSAYYQESVIPKFAREAGYLNQRYGSANLRDGLLHAPDGELLRRVIFEALRASLSVAADFLDAPGRGAIEGAMRSLGACVGDPMNQQNAAALLASLDSLSAVTAKLAASPKSAFLGETIRLAADGLRAKVNP